MSREIVRAVGACVITFLICAVAYPFAVWGMGRLAFPKQAEGRLVLGGDQAVVGSDLIAQPFSTDKYFHPRPSAAGANGYAADAASGSNLGSKNPALRDRIVLDTARILASDGGETVLKTLLERLDAAQAELKKKTDAGEKPEGLAADEAKVAATKTEIVAQLSRKDIPSRKPVPVDLVTASGGGLDPDVTPEGARYQAARVAAARKMTLNQVTALIDSHTDRSGAILGAPPTVNVLRLNLALDGDAGKK